MLAAVGGPASSLRPDSSTSVSAPVHDFDCIYSHDIQRKRQKRWHDGFLRFHTFNSRVMVYDVPRNYIGDTHLKGTESLQEGDEVQLDRGILVEVGEKKGSAQQDVTSLFEKRRPQEPEARGRAERGPGVHTSPSMPGVQLKPKSLNVVLGPRRGVQGRAVLAKKSPYEQVKPAAQQREPRIERPAKRQRVHEAVREPARYVRLQPPQRTLGVGSNSGRAPPQGDHPSRSMQVDETQENLNRAASSSSPTRAPRRRKDAQEPPDILDPPITSVEQSRQSHASPRPQPKSKLKAATTKRPKLMYLSKAAKPQANGETGSPQRRPPLRVATMDEPPSSPPCTNLTIMDFPMSQDFFAAESVPTRKTLADLDRELLDTPLPAPISRSVPVKNRNETAPPPPVPAPPPATPATSPTVPAARIPAEPPRAPSPAAASPSPAPGPAAAPAPAPAPPILRPQHASPLKKSLTDPILPKPGAGVTRPPPRQLTRSASSTTTTSKATGPAKAAPAPAPVRLRNTPPPPEPKTAPAAPVAAPVRASKLLEAAPAPPPPTPQATGPHETDLGPWSRTAFDLFGFVAAGDADVTRARKCAAVAMRGSVRGDMREY